METILYYILRVSIAATIFYVFFKVFVSHTSFFQLNRYVILSIFVTSLFLPILHIQIPQTSHIPQQSIHTILYNIPVFENFKSNTIVKIIPTTKNEITWIDILFIIYLLGVSIVMLRYFVSILKLIQIIRRAQKTFMSDGTLVYVTSQNVSPFSWMKFIVINKKDFIESKFDIILHEKAHTLHYHSMDMMLTDIYCLLFWFNPIAWILRSELQNIHEYQADECVIKDKTNFHNYQLLLIQQSVGEQKFFLANNFQFNHLQKRIKMIMKTKSPHHFKWLYANLLIGLFLNITVMSCTQPNKSEKNTQETTKNIIGKIQGNFNDDTLSGKILIVSVVNSPETIKEGERIVKSRTPKDSVIFQFAVNKGKFEYDYTLSNQQEVKMIFVDNKNIYWAIGFVNPLYKTQTFISSTMVLDNLAETEINILPHTASEISVDNFNNVKIGSLIAEIDGSEATFKLFQEQFNTFHKMK